MIIFMNTQCIVGSPEGNYLFKNVSYLSHFTTQTVVFYVYQKTMLNKRDRQEKIFTIESHDTTNGFYL